MTSSSFSDCGRFQSRLVGVAEEPAVDLVVQAAPSPSRRATSWRCSVVRRVARRREDAPSARWIGAAMRKLAARRRNRRHARRRCRTRAASMSLDGHGLRRWTSSPPFPLSCPAPRMWPGPGDAASRGAPSTASTTRCSDGWHPIDATNVPPPGICPVRRQKRRGRPPAEAVALADIGPAIGVDADRHEPLGDEHRRRRDRRSLFGPSRGSRATTS